MIESPEIIPLTVTSDDWRWSARELAADVAFIIVAASAKQTRRSMEATVGVEEDFRELSEAYRRLEVRSFEERRESFRQRLVRLLEHRLENRDMEGIQWAVRLTGLAPEKPAAAGKGLKEGREAEEGRPASGRRSRFEQIEDARPTYASILEQMSEAELKEVERMRFWHEFTDPEQGLLLTSPEVGEARAILLLRKVRRLIEKGVLQLTQAPPREDFFEPLTGLSLADPQLPEARAVERLLEVRAMETVSHAEEKARVAATPPYNTFAHMGWPRAPIDDALFEEFGPTPAEAQPPDWRDVPEVPASIELPTNLLTLTGPDGGPTLPDTGVAPSRPAHRGRMHTKLAEPPPEE